MANPTPSNLSSDLSSDLAADVPSDSRLTEIQRLQRTDRSAAEALLLAFVRETFPSLDAVKVELRPLAVSLNSFNGFMTLADGRTLFFKTHVEPGGIIGEYYNAALLAKAGYPVIQPLFVSSEYGKQFLIYEVITAPSVFDVARAIELDGVTQVDRLAALTEAQQASDAQLLTCYRASWAWQSAEEAAKAPIHQLFHHRLGNRYAEFYAGKTFALPSMTGADSNPVSLLWESLCQRKWVINGVGYESTLEAAINTARDLLRPDQAGWSIIGHGDAHNGNVFFTADGLVYFDPAFAGRHSPLLDLTKPLFHNVSATWMYHPHEVAAGLHLTWHDDGTTIHVLHDHRPSEVRQMFLNSKVTQVLQPIVAALELENWRAMLRSALLCCPLLTMNLADRAKFPPEIGLLGLCYVVEMGMERVSKSGKGGIFF